MAFSTYQMQRLLARFFRQFGKPLASKPRRLQSLNGPIRVSLSPQGRQAGMAAQQAWQQTEQRLNGLCQTTHLHRVLDTQVRDPLIQAEIERRAGSVLPVPHPVTRPARIPKVKKKSPTSTQAGSLYHKIL